MDPSSVRNIGAGLGYEEVFFSARDKIIAFESPDYNPSLKDISISVWYQKNVVGVILPRLRRKRTYQWFHFNVNSLTQLREIFTDPTVLPYEKLNCSWNLNQPFERNLVLAINQQLQFLNLEEKDILYEKEYLTNALKTLSSQCDCPHEISANVLNKQVDVEHSDSVSGSSYQQLLCLDETTLSRRGSNVNKDTQRLNSENSKLQNPYHAKPLIQRQEPGRSSETESSTTQINHNNSLPKCFMTQPNYTRSESKLCTMENSNTSHLNESPSRFKGNRCLFCFSNEMYHEEFGRAWSAKPVKDVALGRGYVIVYEDGGVAWWDTPKELEQRFSNPNIPLPPVQFVSLGPNGNYFIKFTTGKMEWVAVDSLQTAIRTGVVQRRFSVLKVALGANGSWVILWSHGLVEFEGVPSDMGTILEAENRPGAIGLRDVSLGPHDEWFVIFKDHSVQANNLPDSLHAALVKIKGEGGRLRSVVFGQDTSWYVRLWDGKLASHC